MRGVISEGVTGGDPGLQRRTVSGLRAGGVDEAVDARDVVLSERLEQRTVKREPTLARRLGPVPREIVDGDRHPSRPGMTGGVGLAGGGGAASAATDAAAGATPPGRPSPRGHRDGLSDQFPDALLHRPHVGHLSRTTSTPTTCRSVSTHPVNPKTPWARTSSACPSVPTRSRYTPNPARSGLPSRGLRVRRLHERQAARLVGEHLRAERRAEEVGRRAGQQLPQGAGVLGRGGLGTAGDAGVVGTAEPRALEPEGSISRVWMSRAQGWPEASSAIRPATWKPAPPSMNAVPGAARRGVFAISSTQATSVVERVSRQGERAGSPEVWASSMRRVMAALSRGQSGTRAPAGASSERVPSLTSERITSTLSSLVAEAMGTASVTA